MATTKHKAYTQTIQIALSSELNSLANNTNSSASAEIDNTTNLDLYMDITLYLGVQGANRVNGASVALYFVHALDGTNYDDVLHTTAEIVAIFPLDALTNARQLTRRDVPIPPGKFKMFLRNSTGQALAASGNLVEWRTHSVETT